MHCKTKMSLSITTFTGATISSKCALWTYTCHTPHWWRGVSNNTLLRRGTRIVHNTRVQASFSHASKLWWTVSVNSAFWLLWYHSWNNMHFESQSPTGSYTTITYALHMTHGHLLSVEICKCTPLCDLWHCIQLQEHNCLVCKEVGIPFWWSHCLGQSHIFLWWHSQNYCCTLLQYMQQEGCPAAQVDKHKWQCESLPHTGLWCHKW